MRTTRQNFGSTLALLAKLYKTAEACGDVARARLYVVAVNALLDAWPTEADTQGKSRGDDGPPSGVFSRPIDGPAPGAWSRCERTLVGLGVVPDTHPSNLDA